MSFKKVLQGNLRLRERFSIVLSATQLWRRDVNRLQANDSRNARSCNSRQPELSSERFVFALLAVLLFRAAARLARCADAMRAVAALFCPSGGEIERDSTIEVVQAMTKPRQARPTRLAT